MDFNNGETDYKLFWHMPKKIFEYTTSKNATWNTPNVCSEGCSVLVPKSMA